MNGAAMSTIDIEEWRRRIRADTFSNYHYQMGVALAFQGEVGAAEAAFGRAIAESPGCHQAYHRLRILLMETGRTGEAEAVHARALAVDRDYEARALAVMTEDALNADKPEEALRLAVEARGRLPALAEGLAELLGWVAFRAEETHRTELAETAYREALVCAPDTAKFHSRLWVLRGSIAGDIVQGLHHAREAHRLTPGDPGYLDALNWMLLLNGRYDEALALCREAEARWPDNAYFISYVGITLQLTGDVAGALAAHERAVALPVHPNEISWSMRALGLSAAGRADEAVRSASLGVDRVPDRIFNRAVLALCLCLAGNVDRALTEARKLIASPDQRRLAHLAHAQALVAAGRGDEAAAALRAGLPCEPNSLRYYRDLGSWSGDMRVMMAAIIDDPSSGEGPAAD